jgi:hypothetical protein
MMLAIDLSCKAFIMLRYIPSIPSFFRAFIMKRLWILSKAFSSSIEMIMWLLSWFYLYVILCLLIHIYWTILAMLDETNLIMAFNLINVLLSSACKYFIENFVFILLSEISLSHAFYLLCPSLFFQWI